MKEEQVGGLAGFHRVGLPVSGALQPQKRLPARVLRNIFPPVTRLVKETVGLDVIRKFPVPEQTAVDVEVHYVVVAGAVLLQLGGERLVGARPHDIHLHTQVRLSQGLHQRPRDGAVAHVETPVRPCHDQQDVDGGRILHPCLKRLRHEVLAHHGGMQDEGVRQPGDLSAPPNGGRETAAIRRFE